jgi:hypothetical protein
MLKLLESNVPFGSVKYEGGTFEKVSPFQCTQHVKIRLRKLLLHINVGARLLTEVNLI